MKFIVKCPQCKKIQQTEPRGLIKTSKKKCVFCNHTFKIYKNINDNTLVKKIW